MSGAGDKGISLPKTDGEAAIPPLSFNQVLNGALSALAETLVISLPIGDQIQPGDRELIRQKWESIQLAISETIETKRNELETYIKTIKGNSDPGVVDNNTPESYDVDMGNIIATAVKHKEVEDGELSPNNTNSQQSTSLISFKKIDNVGPGAAGTSKPLKSSLAKPKTDKSRDGSIGPKSTKQKSPKKVIFALEINSPQSPIKSNLGHRISLSENQTDNITVDPRDININEDSNQTGGEEYTPLQNVTDNNQFKQEDDTSDVLVESLTQNSTSSIRENSSDSQQQSDFYEGINASEQPDDDEDAMFDLDEELEYTIGRSNICSDDENEMRDEDNDIINAPEANSSLMSASLPAVVGSFRPRSLSKYIPEFQVPQHASNNTASFKSKTPLTNIYERKADTPVSIYSTSLPLEIMKPRRDPTLEVDTDAIDKSYSKTNEIAKILVEEECAEGDEAESVLLKKMEDNFKKGTMSFTERLTFETVMQKLHDS